MVSDNLKFYIRIIFYILILLCLIYVGYFKDQGNPCDMCYYKNDITNVEMSCRELINNQLTETTKFQSQSNKYNYSNINLTDLFP